jgi:branched-chain amino acid transport system permease protein
MATLALGLIVQEVAVQWDSLTMGYTGISAIPGLGAFGWELPNDRAQLAALLAALGLCIWVSGRLKHSRLGHALAAIAGSEDAARALGIDVARYKLRAFVVAAAYAAFAGSLFVHIVGFVSPEVFGLHMVVLGFTMLYVGGIGTVFGPLIGAFIISLLPETFRGFKEYQDLAYGMALIALLIYAPKGLASFTRLLPAFFSRGKPGEGA